MSQPFINGIRHSWASIECTILDKKISGITAISYSENVEMENLVGAGQMPIGRGIGRYTAKASVTLHMFEVDAIRQSLGGKRLTDIPPFDIIVMYVPGENAQGETLITDVIRNCQFRNDSLDMKEGDVKLEKKLELIVTDIVRK